MSVPVTLVIPAAGAGSRLGLGIPKALAKICGRSLIAWQLDQTRDIEDVRIVVGYMAEDVIDAACAVRRDLTFVFNHDYASTGTAYSLALAAKHARQPLVSLDGDLLVHPRDFRAFCSSSAPCIGCGPVRTSDPVFVRSDGAEGGVQALAFSREAGDLEWTGLLKIAPADVSNSRGHVYQMLERLLPLRMLAVDAREIDTPREFDAAESWLKGHLDAGSWRANP